MVLRRHLIATMHIIILIASGLLAPQSIYSFQPQRINLPIRKNIQSTLRLSTGDDVQKLLEKARQLREEAATMSGKTLQEVEDEAKQQKLAQERIVEKARKEREQSSSGSRSSMQTLPVPDDAKGQNQQAAAAVERAFKDGITRQTVRFALIGQEEAMSGELNEFPGGAKQIYRECGRPLTESLLRELRITTKNNDYSDENEQISPATPPTVTAEDIWDFDGSAIISTNDVNALVFPNTDVKYLKDIEAIDKKVGPDGLFLLVNPYWRDVESWGFNILAPNGKKRAQEVIFDKGYKVTYAVLRFSVRGEDCVAIKSYPYDWQMYAYREDPSWYNQQVPIWLGKSEEEPTSAQITELLNSRPEFKMSKNMRQMQRMMGNDDQ